MKFYILFLVLFVFSCKEKNTLFSQIDGSDSGITFNNKLLVKDTSNVLDNEFFFNGGGVAVGDVNNDGLQDVYFTGNQVENKLYLNQGNLKFKDITDISDAQKKEDQWSSGVSMIDINTDGLLDIFVCNTQHPNAEMRKNNLFINQGIGQDKIPKFKDLATEYGLSAIQNTNSCQFLDFDKDGDLDVFMTVNELDVQYPNQYVTKIIDGTSPTHDLLFKNDFDSKLKHAVFTDVSKNAGIVWPGYSHSSLIHDFNEDGWPDIYISNDYVSNDLIYINDTKGHFTNEIKHIFKHQSYSAMGSDIADINNDGLLDIFTTEMLPFSNKRKKLFIAGNSYNGYLMNDKYDYEYQYIRNTLQLNQGMNPKTGFQTFSDISFLANVHETDWSWSSLFADFDNDGFKDLYVTNGFRKDISDHDFGDYRKNASMNVSRQELYDQIPEIKVSNFVFQNTGKLSFEDKTTDWGLDIPSFSNGAAYADLDNDGDLDVLVNNIDDKAFLFKNTLNDRKQENTKKNNYIRIKLKSELSKTCYGTVVKVFVKSDIQTTKSLSNRGYLSASESVLHFGLDSNVVDSILVIWPDHKVSKILNPNINGVLVIDQKFSKQVESVNNHVESYLKEIDGKILGLDFEHMENDFIDFNFQRTLAHKYSQNGPFISVADINGDGLEDIFIGGSSRMLSTFFIQNALGKFSRKDITFKKDPILKEEELGNVLFDADADGDQDLYIVRGSYQHPPKSGLYKHILCINDGKGNFEIDTLAININTSGLCVKTADINKDGKLDLFVGGNVLPHNFPEVTPSYILLNISQQKDKPRFFDVSKKWNISGLGIVNDAIFTDFNNDTLEDLIIAAEWEPIRLFKNTGNSFVDVSTTSGLSSTLGWWNSLCSIDYDLDGDLDYVAGNYGLNTYFKASVSQPLTLYAKDFDQNKIIEPFITTYWRDSTKKVHEYYFHNRDDMTKQLPSLLKKFPNYGLFGATEAKEVFSKNELEGAIIKKTNQLASVLIKNNGKSKFSMEELPIEAQFAPIHGILDIDVNQDGLPDLVLNGNEYGMELLQGRADAFNGLVLKNNKNGFTPVSMRQSGFSVPRNGKGLAKIKIKGKLHILAIQNKSKLLIFSTKKTTLKRIN
jgi:enediyne biosynthesis protein E4